jgi:WD40 repeat protein
MLRGEICRSLSMVRVFATITWIDACHGFLAAEPQVFVQPGHGGGVMSVAVSPDGRSIISGSSDASVKLWDMASGRKVVTCAGSSRIASVSFSPDGTSFVSTEFNGTVRLWDKASGKVKWAA